MGENHENEIGIKFPNNLKCSVYFYFFLFGEKGHYNYVFP